MNHLRDKAKLLLKNDIGEYMLDKITSGVSAATAVAMSLIGLAIMLQIVFGGSVAFLRRRRNWYNYWYRIPVR